MIIGIISFWGYLFAVLYVTDYYSFTGSSTIFISLNYFFMLMFMSQSFSKYYVKISVLMDEFVIYFIGQSSFEAEGALSKILENAINFNILQVKLKRYWNLFLAFVTLIIYCITSYLLTDNGHKCVAILNSVFIFVLDILYSFN